MPDIDQLKKSQFFQRSDLGPQGVALFTIMRDEQVNVAKENEVPEMKWALILKECSRPLVLNPTNGAIIAAYTGERNTSNWGGQTVVLFWDPNVNYSGKLTGGVRARAPKNYSRMPGGRPASTTPAFTPPPAPPSGEPLPEEPGEDVPY